MGKSRTPEIIYSQAELHSLAEFKFLGREGHTQCQPPAGLQALHPKRKQENRQDKLKNPLQEKTGRETPKGPILNFSQGEKIHWFLGPESTESRKAQRSEIDAARALPSLCSHKELPTTVGSCPVPGHQMIRTPSSCVHEQHHKGKS